MAPPTSSLPLLVAVVLMLTASAAEPETCFSRQHQSAIVNVRLALTRAGTAMDARVVASERDCVLACCSEEVKPDARCNMAVFNGSKAAGDNNCFLFHCDAEQDCPLMKAPDGINTYDIFKGVIHPTTIRPVTTEQTTTLAPPTPTTPQATITTTTTTTTQATSTATPAPAAATDAPPILIVPAVPTATTAPTTTPKSTTAAAQSTTAAAQSTTAAAQSTTAGAQSTTAAAQSTTAAAQSTTTAASIVTTRKSNKTSKKQNKTSKKAKIHAVTMTTQSAVTSHVVEMTSRAAAGPQPTAKTTTLATTTTTTTTSTTTPTSSTTSSTTPTSTTTPTSSTTTTTTTTPATTPSTSTTIAAATPRPTAAATSTLSTLSTQSTTATAESFPTPTSPGSDLAVAAEGGVQADETVQNPASAVDRVAQGKTMAARAAMKSGVVAFMVLALIVLTMALAVGGRKAMESFDRRHYTRLELNDLHYEV